MLIVQEIIYADGVKVYDTVSLGSQWLSWEEFTKKIIAGYDCDALTYNNSDKTIRDHFGHFVANVSLRQARTKLDRAKAAKDDEFYTQYEDIEKEIAEYDSNLFKDKVIYCCCDSEESNFVKYFKNNEDRLGIKKLLHTCYADGYDFRGEECRPYFEEADIVVTNPPFTIIAEFILTLFKYNVDFLFLGSNLIPKLKILFPYFKNNVINIGINSPNRFIRPDGSISNVATFWYTNFLPKVEKPFIHNKITYDESKYQKYIGTNIIDIPVYTDIPEDYDGIMGVPLTFLRYYNKNQFEILGKNLECIRDEDNIMNQNNVLYLLREDGSRHEPFARVLIRRKKICK